MQLEHEFVVPIVPGQAWKLLLAIDQLAPRMAGAALLRSIATTSP